MPGIPVEAARDARRTVLDADRLPVPRRRLLGLATGVARTLPAPDDDPHARLVSAVRALVPSATPELTELDSPALVRAARGPRGRGDDTDDGTVRALRDLVPDDER